MSHVSESGLSYVYFEACLHDDRCCTSSGQSEKVARIYVPALLLLAPDKEGCEMKGCSSMVERTAYNRLMQVRFLTPLPSARSLVDKAAEFYSARRGFESYRARRSAQRRHPEHP